MGACEGSEWRSIFTTRESLPRGAHGGRRIFFYLPVKGLKRSKYRKFCPIGTPKSSQVSLSRTEGIRALRTQFPTKKHQNKQSQQTQGNSKPKSRAPSRQTENVSLSHFSLGVDTPCDEEPTQRMGLSQPTTNPDGIDVQKLPPVRRLPKVGGRHSGEQKRIQQEPPPHECPQSKRPSPLQRERKKTRSALRLEAATPVEARGRANCWTHARYCTEYSEAARELPSDRKLRDACPQNRGTRCRSPDGRKKPR